MTETVGLTTEWLEMQDKHTGGGTCRSQAQLETQPACDGHSQVSMGGTEVERTHCSEALCHRGEPLSYLAQA